MSSTSVNKSDNEWIKIPWLLLCDLNNYVAADGIIRLLERKVHSIPSSKRLLYRLCFPNFPGNYSLNSHSISNSWFSLWVVMLSRLRKRSSSPTAAVFIIEGATIFPWLWRERRTLRMGVLPFVLTLRDVSTDLLQNLAPDLSPLLIFSSTPRFFLVGF